MHGWRQPRHASRLARSRTLRIAQSPAHALRVHARAARVARRGARLLPEARHAGAARRDAPGAATRATARSPRAFHQQLFDEGLVGRRLAEGVRRPREVGRRAVHLHRGDGDGGRAGDAPLRSPRSRRPSCAPAPRSRRRRGCRRILRGEIEFAVAYSEPDAGTDLAALTTRAELDGDEWVINGQKIWNTGAHTATHNWVAVRTEPDAPKHQGISMIIVPMDAPGIEVQGIWTMSNIRTNARLLRQRARAARPPDRRARHGLLLRDDGARLRAHPDRLGRHAARGSSRS